MSSPQAVTRPKKMKLPKALQRSEHDEQKELFAWMAVAPVQYQAALSMAFAIPNFAGHHGSAISRMVSGKRAKDEGRRAGVPDVFLPVARGGSHGLFVEMKKANGIPSDVKPEQAAWHRALRHEGYSVAIAYGFEEARAAIITYLNLKENV